MWPIRFRQLGSSGSCESIFQPTCESNWCSYCFADSLMSSNFIEFNCFRLPIVHFTLVIGVMTLFLCHFTLINRYFHCHFSPIFHVLDFSFSVFLPILSNIRLISHAIIIIFPLLNVCCVHCSVFFNTLQDFFILFLELLHFFRPPTFLRFSSPEK